MLQVVAAARFALAPPLWLVSILYELGWFASLLFRHRVVFLPDTAAVTLLFSIKSSIILDWIFPNPNSSQSA